MLVTLWVCIAMLTGTLLGAADTPTQFFDTSMTTSIQLQPEAYDGWCTLALIGGVAACVLISVGMYVYVTRCFEHTKNKAFQEYARAHEQFLHDLADKQSAYQTACAATAQEQADSLRCMLDRHAATAAAALEKVCQDQQRALEQEHARQQAMISSLSGHHITVNTDQKVRLEQAAREHVAPVAGQIRIFEQALQTSAQAITSDYVKTQQQLEKLLALAGVTIAENTASMSRQREECLRFNNETLQKIDGAARQLNQKIDRVKKICEDFVSQASS